MQCSAAPVEQAKNLRKEEEKEKQILNLRKWKAETQNDEKIKSSLICERNSEVFICISRHSKEIRRKVDRHKRVDNNFVANYCGLSSICTNLFILDYIGLVAATLGITMNTKVAHKYDQIWLL